MERAELIALSDPGSLVVEAYRNVRSAIRTAGEDMRVVEITGVAPGEENSVFAANLAVVMAQAGKKVLLVDCDFAHPAQHTLFQVENSGLFDAVSTGGDVRAFCRPTRPSVIASADALAAAACADGTVLVVESGKEEPKTVQLAKKRLEQAKAKILGCVLNDVKVNERYDDIGRLRGESAK